MEEETTTRSELGLSLIKQLASCEKGSRDRALSQLIDTWLPSQPEVSEDLMRKLWKGLFYAFWHSDKFPAQSELADKLSSSVVELDIAVSIPYLSAFFLTMRREWSGIDVLRLDKFYLLIRRFVNSIFVSLRKSSWDLDLTRRFVEVLESNVFFAEDKLRGNGVSYHVASVFLDELFGFLPVRPEVVEVLFDPFVLMLGKVPDKVLLGKIKSNVFDALVQKGKAFLGDKTEPSRIASVILSMGFATRLYELGSSPDCLQGNRRTIFALHEDFLKLEKDFASSGVEEEEIAELVPIIPIDETEAALKKCCNGVEKKSKKKKKKKDNKVEPLEEEEEEEEEMVTLDESAISNLQSQFEKIAAEAGLSEEVPSSCESPPSEKEKTVVSKKRKRSEKKEKKKKVNSSDETEATETSEKKKEKKRVKFSMKSNLVWKGQSPLPEHSLRLPPSAKPRGSALKKGVPAGPVREVIVQPKRANNKPMRAKRARKNVKRLKKKPVATTT